MKKILEKFKKDLLFGTSHMIPFIVAGGVLLSLAVMMSGKGAVPETGILKHISDVGIAGLTILPLILGGYIAYSIADRAALAPAMIGTHIAVTQYKTGFLGAIIVGFIAGYVVLYLKKIPLSKTFKSLGPIFIYPLAGSLFVSFIVIFVIGTPVANLMNALNEMLSSFRSSSKVVLGAILGGMTAFDMGGPVNKVATLFAQTQVSTQPWLMGGVGVAICTPPIGMALATFLSPSKYSKEEKDAGVAALLMGMIGISEGAIPFAVSDPIRVIPSLVVGGMVGNIVAFLLNVINHAPWGGWIVLPVVENKLGYIIATIAGSLVTAVLVNILKSRKATEEKQEIKEEEEKEIEIEFE